MSKIKQNGKKESLIHATATKFLNITQFLMVRFLAIFKQFIKNMNQKNLIFSKKIIFLSEISRFTKKNHRKFDFLKD